MSNQQYIEIEDQYSARNYHPLDVVIQRGEGVWLYDVAGQKYLDCLSGYSAVNQGHCHPKLVEVMKMQLEKLTLTSRAFRNDQFGAFCKEICELTDYEMVLAMNTGAEAVETAIKAARRWAYQTKQVPDNQAEIIVADNNFHGRTTTIISFSSAEAYKDQFGPFTPGFKIVSYGDTQAIEDAITPHTAAIMVEPIQGEGGVVIPPDGYLKRIRQLCDENTILFMADEIQTGLGRTGKLFACDYEEVKPDVMIVGKALSGGFYPVSAVLASEAVLGLFKPGDHGSTFSGNPLGMAVARKALDVLVSEGMIENAYSQGTYFAEQLNQIESPHIESIRARGLLIGVVLKQEAGGARRFCEALEGKGILCKETHDHIIRFAPPLTITRDQIDWALERIVSVLQ